MKNLAALTVPFLTVALALTLTACGAPSDVETGADRQAITRPRPHCGSMWDPCCAGSTCSNAALTCIDTWCTPCGTQSQVCCYNAPNFCGAGLSCTGAAPGVCTAPCGAAGQPCCYGGDAGAWGACMPGLECGGGAPASCL